MIKLSFLNKECRNRTVASTAPSHIFCRILGNAEKPCPLNKICKPADEKGIAYFYCVLASIIIGIYIVLFWLLKITRLNKPIMWLLSFVLKPLKSLAYALAYLLKFYKGLPR